MNTTVYIGAPEPSELQSLLSDTATRVIVVDPLPGLEDRLRSQYAGSHLEVLEVAVSASGANQLHEYGMQNLSSLHKPNKLARLYPGLKARAVHPVVTLAPSELPERLKLSGEEENSLHINAPGEERSITQQLVETKAINHFKRLSITIYSPGMYVDDHAEIDLKSLLKKAGFNIKVSSGKSSLYERLECTFDVNRARIRALEKELKQANDKLEETRQHSREEREKLKANLNKEKEKNGTLQSEMADLNTRFEQLNQSNRDLKTKLERLQEEVKERREAADQLAPLKQQVSTLEQEHSELQEKFNAEQSALVRAHAIIDDLKTQLKTQTAENEQQVEAEFIKAESQLELIKDLLIREKLF